MEAQAAQLIEAGFGRGNTASLSELLASFLPETGVAFDLWGMAAAPAEDVPDYTVFKCVLPTTLSSIIYVNLASLHAMLKSELAM